MRSNHDIAIGMLNGYIESMIDPQCSVIAVRASAGTATLIFRTLGVISAKEDNHYTERLRRAFERREGSAL
ncbi:hypothetical protein [Pseudomonas lundensis]|uniref:hypothetical protein n=1 Tax=Pseudomonas lundensis TaxID=86185 RepID=UPI001472FFEF|nr:hypothetical protein [Pseudomonas lundensis]NNA40013.1 hypothetical protein [Pseudomonas lundensis]